MILKRCFGIITMIVFMAALHAQVEESVQNGGNRGKEREKIPFSQRLVFGGDLGLSFGTITYIKIAPIVGYKVTDRLTAGLGPIYIYESYKNYNLKTSTYGGKALVSFTIIRGSSLPASIGIGDIVLHAENEVINLEPTYYNPFTFDYFFGDRIWINNLLLGGGLSQSLGGKFAVSIFVLWDVTQNQYSPYSNPIFRFGFTF
jgi:hypothetical protein